MTMIEHKYHCNQCRSDWIEFGQDKKICPFCGSTRAIIHKTRKEPFYEKQTVSKHLFSFATILQR